MYNWRYHIATLVAVFLALAVGLLLGTVVVERGLLDAQRTTLVESIQKDVDKVRSSNQSLVQRNDALTSFADDVAPGLVADQLAGRNILVIGDPAGGETVARVTEIVRGAGGEVSLATFSRPGLGLGDPAVVAAVSGLLGSPPAEQVEARLTEALVREWTTPNDPRAVTEALVGAGVLKMTALAPSTAVSGTVVTAAFESAPDTGTITLAKSLGAASRYSVGVETAARANGVAKAAQDAGISAVDDVSTSLGEISLVWVLSGRASGRFGYSEGAVAPFPQPLFVE